MNFIKKIKEKVEDNNDIDCLILKIDQLEIQNSNQQKTINNQNKLLQQQSFKIQSLINQLEQNKNEYIKLNEIHEKLKANSYQDYGQLSETCIKQKEEIETLQQQINVQNIMNESIRKEIKSLLQKNNQQNRDFQHVIEVLNQINNESIQERNELLQMIQDMNSHTFRAKIINFAKTIKKQ
jgi:hypothetical protein